MGEAKRRARDMDQPCYRTTLFHGARPIRLAVWNGRQDYESQPPDVLLDKIGGPRLLVLQVGPHTDVTLSDHIAETDSIVLWASDATVYRRTVDALKGFATLRADDKPIALFGRSSLEERVRLDWARGR